MCVCVCVCVLCSDDSVLDLGCDALVFTWTRFIDANHMKFLCLESCLRYCPTVTGCSWGGRAWPMLSLGEEGERGDTKVTLGVTHVGCKSNLSLLIICTADKCIPYREMLHLRGPLNDGARK